MWGWRRRWRWCERHRRRTRLPPIFIKILAPALAGSHHLSFIMGDKTTRAIRGNWRRVPMHPRRHARVKPAGLVSRQAKIITDPRAPVIVCTLIDYSPGGACVDLGGQVK